MDQKHILLAEDDEMLATLLKYRLEKAGFAVEVARDGREVREALKTNRPDILVCDIMMPYYTGIETVDYVRKELQDNLPIIMLSTAGNETNVLNAFELGADDFIAKPVSPSELVVRINRLLIKTRA
ncbi:Response regulator receiver domain-containing protein [Robiginitalea myxolifaciens]|uniref:Response regulator receiver domain-containing protein n=1 Tax=Robiginitalea myxolifaciens TaxID=400055 RepID=A0A1I6GX57_9FLAO|nr:response regulator transcription factor [Robiginitalea myxolifaciens]SFR46843.1 Response regulator receiver domain-containing protein [Robiginitalea myxolifaciens]